jgi:hypothetical protein
MTPSARQDETNVGHDQNGDDYVRFAGSQRARNFVAAY